MKKKQTKKSLIDKNMFPANEILHRLAISDNGFVFDPASGNSFTVNQTGLVIIDLLRKEMEPDKALEMLQQEFDVSINTLERDVLDFARSLLECLGSS